MTAMRSAPRMVPRDRKSTRLNSSHTEIYTLSLHDALPICCVFAAFIQQFAVGSDFDYLTVADDGDAVGAADGAQRSEEHTSELQSHRDLHSFPTRRSSDLLRIRRVYPAIRCGFRFRLFDRRG